MSFNHNTNTVDEYEMVVNTVQKYVEGLRVASIPMLKDAFHSEAIMYGLSPDGLLGGTINNLYDFVNQYGTAPNVKTRVDVLAITPTTACVKVTMERDAAENDYTDLHCLIKIDGKWSIVAKLFHLYDK